MTSSPHEERKALLLRIAERCEKEEPSRELDASIVVALDLRPDWCSREGGVIWIDKKTIINGEPAIRINALGGRNSQGNPPIGAYLAYTTSLDAAITLVPDRLGWMIRDYRDGAASVLVNYSPRAAMKQDVCVASNPALALCAAALKARAALSSDGGCGEYKGD